MVPTVPTIVGVVLALLVVFFAISRYKVARIDQALIVTGGKKAVIKRSGGKIVWPIIRKHNFLDLCVLTITNPGDVIKTKTGVTTRVSWTAQIRVNADDDKALEIAATSFLERTREQIVEDVKLTLDGSVRGVVAELTPEQVMREKEEFGSKVKDSVAGEMTALGFLLVSLNIQDVDDDQGYFENLATRDRVSKQQEADISKAEADQNIRQKKAEADRIAQQAELDSRVQIAERTRDTEVKEAEFKTQTERAKADASISGQLQDAIRQKELATNQGQVQVEREKQLNLAAQEHQSVATTEAETEKIRLRIQSEAEAAKASIDAKASAEVKKETAAGEAEATRTRAKGDADAVREQATAEADRTTKQGEAEATATRVKGLAEAETIEAIGLAKAKAEEALAQARASNDGVNFKVAIAEIEANARIKIATSSAEVMASVGQKAQFIDLGGGRTEGGDVMTRVLANFPSLLKQLNIENGALNGAPVTDSLREVVDAVIGPLGVLNKETVKETKVIEGGSATESSATEDSE